MGGCGVIFGAFIIGFLGAVLADSIGIPWAVGFIIGIIVGVLVMGKAIYS